MAMANRIDDTGANPPREPAAEPANSPDRGLEPTPSTDPADVTLAQNKTPEAMRALAEAEARRRRMAQIDTSTPVELGGRDGPDPARYGDWEKGGIASDF